MIVEKNIGAKDYLFCDVPKDVIDIELHNDEDGGCYFTYHTGMGTDNYDILRETLPEGNYSIVGMPLQLTEEQWKGIVETFWNPILLEHGKFIDYSHKTTKIYTRFDPLFDKATESGLSLIKSIGKEPETTLIILKN